jgi:uncharacterized DUF497 family protein
MEEEEHEPRKQAMDFERDEEKRLKNVEKHGINFIDADILFGDPHLGRVDGFDQDEAADECEE